MSKALFQALLRTDLKAFTEKAFATVDPGTEYLDNWHVSAITWRLEQCFTGKSTRLIITQPPRSMKSICASIAFVAWALGRDPKLKFICVSYSQDLALALARQCRMVMESDWYREIFPGTVLTRSTDGELVTSSGGGRLATSIGGTLTGRGADYIVLDDPLKAEDAQSEAARRKVIDWHRGTLSTRLNDKKTGRIILTMQRLHEEDLAGHLLEAGTFEHLDLPARAIEEQRIRTGPDSMHHRKASDILHPEREGEAELARAERDLGSMGFSAQYQQRPVPAEGNLVQRRWLKYCDAEAPAGKGQVVQSWDTASTDSTSADYSVCVTAVVDGQTIRVLHVLRDRMNFPDLVHRCISHAQSWRVNTVLVENVGAGQHLIDSLRTRRAAGVPTPISIQPDRDKVSRLHAASVVIERGDLLLPSEAPWLASFVNELLAFPNARHDDQVDALSQLINWQERRRWMARETGGIGTLGVVPAGEYICSEDRFDFD